MVLEDIPNMLGEATQTPAASTAQTLLANQDPVVLIIGVVLIIATVLLLLFLKKILVNSLSGLVLWAIATFVFHVDLPFYASLIVSLVFGPAGICTLMILRFMAIA